MVTTLHGEHLVMNMIVESECCTCQTNRILFIKYISIKNKKYQEKVNFMKQKILDTYIGLSLLYFAGKHIYICHISVLCIITVTEGRRCNIK